MTTGVPAHGAVSFLLKPRKMTDATPCRFPAARETGVAVDMLKYPDGSVQIEVDGPHGRTWSFKATPPAASDPAGVEVAIKWDAAAVALYLAGTKVQEQKV